jgi:hypothetical protein
MRRRILRSKESSWKWCAMHREQLSSESPRLFSLRNARTTPMDRARPIEVARGPAVGEADLEAAAAGDGLMLDQADGHAWRILGAVLIKDIRADKLGHCKIRYWPVLTPSGLS